MSKKIKVLSNCTRFTRKSLTRISPELATKVLYRIKFKKSLNLKEPKTFNEKLLWIKLFDKNELKTICADKYEATIYAKEQDCGEIVNEIYNVYNSVEEIEWEKLPKKFALKCTHSCGTNIICNDKNNFDINEAKKKLKKWMKEDYSLEYAEIHYKNIKPRIICEKFIEGDKEYGLIDYKIYCFNGEPLYTLVCWDRNGKVKKQFYDINWNKSNFRKDFYEGEMKCPKSYNEMLKYAKKLSKGFKFVRVDFYEQNGKPILGELTFTPAGCLSKEYTDEAEIILGDLIKLPI